MRLAHIVQRIRESLRRRPRARRAAPGSRPQVECLEQRTVPTIAFSPNWAGETLAYNSANAGLSSPPVYLIFWGTNWNQTQSVKPYLNAAQNLLSPSCPYFSKLTQYGSDGKAAWGGYYVDRSVVTGPQTVAPYLPTPFSQNNLQTEVQKVIDDPSTGIPHPAPSGPTPIYVVVTDSSAKSDQKGAAGYNIARSLTTPVLSLGQTQVSIPVASHLVWTSTIPDGRAASLTSPNTIDTFTSILSHELVESMTVSADGTARVLVSLPASLPQSLRPTITTKDATGKTTTTTTLTGQIGDGEPDGRAYGYRLNGVWVQPYWSQQDHAFVVPDSTSSTSPTFTLAPAWNAGTFSGQYDLLLTGDQGGAATTDTITIDRRVDGSGANFLRTTLNGPTAEFNANAIRQVIVDPQGGYNFVRVAGLPANESLTTRSGAPATDFVTVGWGGSLASVAGSVTIDSYKTYLTVDDSSDGTPRTITVNSGSVAVGGLATVNFPSTVMSLSVYGGRGGNEVDVNSTSALTSVWVNAGLGSNSVNVRGASGPLSVSGRGRDYVLVGNNHSLAGITGAVSVGNGSSGMESLTIDASLDPVRNLTITDHSVSFDGGLTISYVGASVTGGSGVTDLVVNTAQSDTATKIIAVQSLPAATNVTVYGDPGDWFYGRLTSRFQFLLYPGDIINLPPLD